MLKKAHRQRRRQQTPRRRALGGVVAAAMLLALMASGAAVYRRESLRARPGVALTALPAQSTSAPLTLAKEYIYADGRLVATEEPPAGDKTNCCVDRGLKQCRCYNEKLPKPAALVATPAGPTQVSVSWSSAGEGLSYEVERSTSIDGPFTPVSLHSATTFTDAGLGTCVGYLYRVRTVDALGDFSDYSNVDIATTCAFSQDPLVPQSNIIKALHLEELRLAVEAVRATASLPSVSWTDPALAGKRIRAVHLEELRSRLDEALGRLNLPAPPPYTDATLTGVVVKAAHIQELRQRVK